MTIPQEILERKRNIFDHILYEIDMYVYSYNTLAGISQKDISQLGINALLDCHGIHLRNLICFFETEGKTGHPDDITIKTIFNDNLTQNFTFHNEEIEKIRHHINKSIGHLTKSRYMENKSQQDNLTSLYTDEINLMFHEKMSWRIEKLLGELNTATNVKADLIDQLQKPYIQAQIYQLIDLINVR